MSNSADTKDEYCKFTKQREELLAMAEEDQKVRIDIDEDDPHAELIMRRTDYENYKKLLEILDIIGTPSVENIGYDGAQAAWLVAHHNTFSLALLESMLQLIKECTKEDKTNGYYRGIPYLQDRINILKGKKQLYGTQWWKVVDDKLVPYPILDIESLDERRAEYGLESFTKYKDIIQRGQNNGYTKG